MFGHFAAIFLASKNKYFSETLEHIAAFFLTTKTGILSKTMFFCKNPDQVVFVPKPDRTLTTESSPPFPVCLQMLYQTTKAEENLKKRIYPTTV